MSNRHKVESALTLKRIYNVPLARLWHAWTDPAELGQWYVAGDDHIVHFCEADVRVGGKYRVGFGPRGKNPIVETGEYTEVVPMTRLSFQESVAIDGTQIHSNLTVIDFQDLGANRSQLVLISIGTDSWRTGEGWTPCLESLARFLGER